MSYQLVGFGCAFRPCAVRTHILGCTPLPPSTENKFEALAQDRIRAPNDVIVRKQMKQLKKYF